jgi:hypothetical protein
MADIAYFLAENANSTSKNHRTFAPENKRYFSSSKKNHFLMETNKKIANQQQTNLHFCDERVELLDTIREIVKMEVDKRIEKLKKDKKEDLPPQDTFFIKTS